MIKTISYCDICGNQIGAPKNFRKAPTKGKYTLEIYVRDTDADNEHIIKDVCLTCISRLLNEAAEMAIKPDKQ